MNKLISKLLAKLFNHAKLDSFKFPSFLSKVKDIKIKTDV